MSSMLEKSYADPDGSIDIFGLKYHIDILSKIAANLLNIDDNIKQLSTNNDRLVFRKYEMIRNMDLMIHKGYAFLSMKRIGSLHY